MAKLVVGLLYLAVVLAEAVWSYSAPTYRFNQSALIMAMGFLGAVATLAWWRRRLGRWDWLLAVGLVVVMLASFPGTSRDHVRYLFDGEMIRLFHASPYAHLPYEFPVDQYSQIFHHIWWTAIPSPYGPLWQALMVGVNFLSGNVLAVGVILLKLVNLAGLGAVTWYLWRISGKPWLAYVFLTNPVVLMNTVATPHTDILLAAALLAAYYHRGLVSRGLLLGGSVLVKVHMLMFLPFLAKTWRGAAALVGVTGLVVAGGLLALKPLVGFDWLPMLKAAQGGGATGLDSSLFYQLLPGLSTNDIILASYGLFCVGYGSVLALYVRRQLKQVAALALASLLVPLCLTGVLLPWHFLVPMTWLLLWGRREAVFVMVAFTLLVMRSAMAVLQLIVTVLLLWAGYLVLGWVYRRLSAPPPALTRAAWFLRL